MGTIAKRNARAAKATNQTIVEAESRAVDPEKLLWNQEAAILDTTELVCALMKEAGISRSELAARLGTTKSNVTQILDGSRNMTIRTVSDMMTCLGHEFRASCKAREAKEDSHVVFRVMAEVRIPIDKGTSSDVVIPQNVDMMEIGYCQTVPDRNIPNRLYQPGGA